MRVLVDGVVTAIEGGGADVEALLVGDFFGADEARGVAGAGGGDGGVEGMGPRVAESDSGRSGFDKLAGERVFKHAGLGGHLWKDFNTDRDGRNQSQENDGKGYRRGAETQRFRREGK